MMTKKRKPNPTTADAEKWLTPETFLYRGVTYRVTPDCKVVRADEDPPKEKQEGK